ncbi:MAG TPA: endo-polygalacturonase, partial [Verrucomicrobiae bacterium]|nr:endo-polygalacturonase [Verrucomicrobiae bacterium]
MKPSVLLLLALFFINSVVIPHAGTVVVYPAPVGEELSRAYQVTVEGHAVPVYTAKVAPADPVLRWKAMDDKANSANYFETAAFASFDMQGTVTVQVTCPEDITSAKILPSALNLQPLIKGKSLSLTLTNPGPVTVEINGNWVQALHLFANPPETNAPTATAPGVIYFGPGIHEITHLVVTNNQTLYVAGGAILRGVIGTNEPFSISSYSGLRNYSPTIELRGTNIMLRGRGIIDGTACPTHARHLVFVQGTNICLEGVILR